MSRIFVNHLLVQVIGHEITHGFDDQGREYDADGNMRSWWTKLALDNFEERTKCFVEQYSSYSLDGQAENGQRTLSKYNVISSIPSMLRTYEKYNRMFQGGNRSKKII